MRTITAAAAVLLLASCSSGTTTTDDTEVVESTTIATTTTAPAATTTAAPETTTTSTSTTTSTTTSTLAPMEAAQVAYFVISADANTRNAEAAAPWPDTIPWAEYPTFCAAAAVITEDFAKAIDQERWPRSARDEAAELVRTNAAVAGLYYQCATTVGTQAIADVAAQIQAAEEEAGAAASAMRLALDLPIDR